MRQAGAWRRGEPEGTSSRRRAAGARPYTYPCRAHTRTHAHAHTRTRTRAHTRAHAHTPAHSVYLITPGCRRSRYGPCRVALSTRSPPTSTAGCMGGATATALRSGSTSRRTSSCPHATTPASGWRSNECEGNQCEGGSYSVLVCGLGACPSRGCLGACCRPWVTRARPAAAPRRTSGRSVAQGDGRARPRQRALWPVLPVDRLAWRAVLRDGAPPLIVPKPPPPAPPMPICMSHLLVRPRRRGRLSEPTRPSTPRCASWRVSLGSSGRTATSRYHIAIYSIFTVLVQRYPHRTLTRVTV